MGLLKFRPARGQYAPEDALVIADLDALLVEDVHFKLLGKKHTIKPFTQEQFLRVMSKYSIIINKTQSGTITREQRNKLYADLFSSVCNTLGAKEVDQMTDTQIGATLQLIIDTVAGRIQGEVSKKKVTDSLISPPSV